MRRERQLLILDAIKGDGKYRYDKKKGVLTSWRVGKKKYVELKCTYNIVGQKAYDIFTKNGRIKVLAHHIVILAEKGEFPETNLVYHLNGNHDDCRLENLGFYIDGDFQRPEPIVKNNNKNNEEEFFAWWMVEKEGYDENNLTKILKISLPKVKDLVKRGKKRFGKRKNVYIV